MDLRSIINSDTPPVSHPAAARETPPSPAEARGDRSAANRPLAAFGRPPPPLQTSLQPLSAPPNELRSTGTSSSAYSSARSPYHSASPSSALSGGQYPFPPPQPSYGRDAVNQYAAVAPKEHTPSTAMAVPLNVHNAYGQHPSQYPNASSAHTPGGTYHYAQPYPVQRAHASPTLSTARNQPTYPSAESPVSPQSRPFPHPQPYPTLQSHSPTPIGQSASQSFAAVAAPRPEQSQSWTSRPYSSSGIPTTPAPIDIRSPSMPSKPAIEPQASAYTPTPAEPFQQANESSPPRNEADYATMQNQRERSISVSPKTRLPNLHKPDSVDGSKWSGQVTPAKRKKGLESEDEPEPRPNIEPSPGTSQVNGTRNVEAESRPTLAESPARRAYFDPIQKKKSLEKEDVPSTPLQPANGQEAVEAKATDGSVLSGKDREATSSPAQSAAPPPPITPYSSSGRDSPPAQLSPGRPAPAMLPSPSALPSQGSSSQRDSHASLTSGTATTAAASAISTTSVSPSHPPAKKRIRHDEPPIFARKASRSTSSSPVIANRRQPGMAAIVTSSLSAKQEPRSAAPYPTDASAAIKEGYGMPQAAETGGATATTMHTSVPNAQPVAVAGDEGPLGPWEPSITNMIPYEEMTRKIMDFLFMEVVERKDVGGGTTGTAPVSGAQLEIEAKLGQIIDRNTNERMRLPVLTECIFNKDHPSFRTIFRSSMTETQHRTLNQFLNKAVVSSNTRQGPPPGQHGSQTAPNQAAAAPPSSGAPGAAAAAAAAPQAPPPPGASTKPRIPLQYVHTRELDRFYELPHAQLPAIPLSVRASMNQRHRCKVRVTHDQKTGEELARIVKIRIADLDVYSPRTAFDWRISVNLEMPFEGDVAGLPEASEAPGGKGSKRSKDRMTYKHLAYQIDLTQVILQADSATGKAEKEHELEVEVSAAKVRELGQLAKQGQANPYEDLIKGFVDNVRILARVISSA